MCVCVCRARSILPAGGVACACVRAGERGLSLSNEMCPIL